MKQGRVASVVIALALFLLPTAIARHVANFAGHHIEKGARIGFSLLMTDYIAMSSSARVRHFSFIKIRRLLMRENSAVGNLNMCSGPFSIWLEKSGVIGNRNSVSRAPAGVSYGAAQLRLGELSKITAGHSIDCCSSVIFGDFTTLAGKGSQIWSHGYVHRAVGSGRYRIDGSVTLGNNVYVGSGCIITGGVSVVDHVTIGAGVSVSKSLSEAGFYVSSPIVKRSIPSDPETRSDLEQIDSPDLVETVYVKKQTRVS